MPPYCRPAYARSCCHDPPLLQAPYFTYQHLHPHHIQAWVRRRFQVARISPSNGSAGIVVNVSGSVPEAVSQRLDTHHRVRFIKRTSPFPIWLTGGHQVRLRR
ncbi:hypothetical protein KCP71_00820 [Salmonella enterica subsp. enterica]|nr:hypothetical protein KCP71_00820 [Salmonella enterica subsp. enterica]